LNISGISSIPHSAASRISARRPAGVSPGSLVASRAWPSVIRLVGRSNAAITVRVCGPISGSGTLKKPSM